MGSCLLPNKNYKPINTNHQAKYQICQMQHSKQQNIIQIPILSSYQSTQQSKTNLNPQKPLTNNLLAKYDNKQARQIVSNNEMMQQFNNYTQNNFKQQYSRLKQKTIEIKIL